MQRDSPWYASGLRFSCTGCGGCCRGPGYVWVTHEEIEALAQHVELDWDDFTRRFVRQVSGRLSLVDNPAGDCVFWDEGCQVYDARPRQCRTFPFWNEHLQNPEAWKRVAQESPGVNQGRRYSRSEIESLRKGSGAAESIEETE